MTDRALAFGPPPAPCCSQSQGVRAHVAPVMHHRWWLDVRGLQADGTYATVYVTASFCPWCGTQYREPERGG